MAEHGEHRAEERSLFGREALPHLDALYGAALHLTRNPDDAQDLCQEAMLHAYRAFHQFSPGTNCRAWLLTILYNLFRNGYRRGQRESSVLEAQEAARALGGEEPIPDNPESALTAQDFDQEIETALGKLPEEFRITLMMVDAQELSYQETARVLGVPVGTVRSRLSRARALMRSTLADFAAQRGFKRPPPAGK